MDNDDKPIGRVLSRREVMKLLGGAGIVLIGGTMFTNRLLAQTPEATEAVALPSCVVRPEMTQGPYFVDEQLNRSDVRIEPTDGSVKEGIPLHLIFNVSSITADACVPLAGAQVDIWNCDALGEYSAVEDMGFNNVGEKWLRGYQITDENGVAEFISIYPGWYSGRTVHLHFKIRTDIGTDTAYEFTSQFYFPDELTDEVFTQEPYASNGERDTRNDTDMHYAGGGEQVLLDLTEVSAEEMASAIAAAQALSEVTPEVVESAVAQGGYQTIFTIGLDLTDEEVGASDAFDTGMGGGGTGGPGGAPPSGGGTGPGAPSTTATPGS